MFCTERNTYYLVRAPEVFGIKGMLGSGDVWNN